MCVYLREHHQRGAKAGDHPTLCAELFVKRHQYVRSTPLIDAAIDNAACFPLRLELHDHAIYTLAILARTARRTGRAAVTNNVLRRWASCLVKPPFLYTPVGAFLRRARASNSSVAIDSCIHEHRRI